MKALKLILCWSILINLSYAQEHGIINNSKSPYVKLKSIDIDDCRWTEGFWAQKLALCHQVMIPNLGRLMEDPETIHAYENFLVAAALKEGVFKGWSFHDGDFYKYLEALCYAYAMTRDIWVNLYGSNVLDTELADGSGVRLTQKTDYPWDGLVEIIVDVPEEKVLYDAPHLVPIIDAVTAKYCEALFLSRNGRRKTEHLRGDEVKRRLGRPLFGSRRA